MKKFSDRINADWYTTKRLSELLDEFFDDEDEPKTLTHLYCWLNIDWTTYLERSLDDRFRALLIAAENECEKWVVNHGFLNDKSFAKFELGRNHSRELNGDATSNDNDKVIVNLMLDPKSLLKTPDEE